MNSTVAKLILPEAMHRQLRMTAADQRRSVSSVARELIGRALQTQATPVQMQGGSKDRGK